MRATKSIVLALAAALSAASTALAQDPLAELSRNVAAVLAPGPEGKILVVEEAHGASNVRTFAVGDDYAGWRIEYIGPDSVRVQRGGETRIVRILGRAQAQAEPGTMAPVAAFSSAVPVARLSGLAERPAYQPWAPNADVASGPPVPLLLSEAEAQEALSGASNLLPRQLGPDFDISKPPVLTPEIEAELKRSLGIR